MIKLPRITEIYAELYTGKDLYGLLEDALEKNLYLILSIDKDRSIRINYL